VRVPPESPLLVFSVTLWVGVVGDADGVLVHMHAVRNHRVERSPETAVLAAAKQARQPRLAMMELSWHAHQDCQSVFST